MEKRFLELRSEGRSIVGAALRYGDTARTPGGLERFEAGAFGDVGNADVILNLQHDRTRPLARTQGGGLRLTDSAEALQVTATLPETRDANDALALVKSGVLRGLSVEFHAIRERFEEGHRIIKEASLVGIGLVDRPAYPASIAEARFEVRQEGRGLRVRIPKNKPVTIRDRGRVRKEQYGGNAFRYSLGRNIAESNDIDVFLGDRSKPLGSRNNATATFGETDIDLSVLVPRLPDTTYVADMRAYMAAGNQYGARVFWRKPPPDVVANAVETIPEPGNPGVEILLLNDVVLTGIQIAARPPAGNPGSVELRRKKRSRLWL